ncbi:hypothetical protein K1719_015202 [Acacia pycnantha]|nr:hypothetical protein K1719_015202 [Acacia pycnantha]
MDVKGRGSNSPTLQQADAVDDDLDLRRGPWTVDEDLTLINYITTHGEGRWNSLARSAGLKRTGKSCRLRWLNYLRPDVRRGNITLEEQLMILELHSRWGNRWSKIAQYLPGRTDNEIKNYWRTRVQKHARQLKCDVNSKQFKDTMRYLWMPRLVERIQAAAAATTASSQTLSAATTVTTNSTYNHYSNNMQVENGNMLMNPAAAIMNNNNNDFGGSQVTQSYTPENSSTGASSDSFGTQVSPVSELTDYYSTVPNNNQEYYQPSQMSYSDCITSPSRLYPQGLDYSQVMDPNNPWIQGGDTLDNLWNVENMMFLQQQLNIDSM